MEDKSYNFVDKDNCSHVFLIVDNWKFYNNDIIYTMPAVLTFHLKDESEFFYALKIIKNNQSEFIVQWSGNAIRDYAYIEGYKEFIDRTVKLLVFS